MSHNTGHMGGMRVQVQHVQIATPVGKFVYVETAKGKQLSHEQFVAHWRSYLEVSDVEYLWMILTREGSDHPRGTERTVKKLRFAVRDGNPNEIPSLLLAYRKKDPQAQ